MKKLDVMLANPHRHWAELGKLLRAPPTDVVERLARTVIGLQAFSLGRKCKQIAPAVIRSVLAEAIPPRMPPWTNKHDVPTLTRNLIFLKEAVPLDSDDDALQRRWQEALQALLDVQSYEWGSRQRRVKLAAIAHTPRLLQAIQAAVVGTPPADDACSEFLAVLVVDGSAASFDALMPHLHHATTTGDGLERLERLRTYAANTAPMLVMFAKIDELLEQRSATAPPVALLRDLGITVNACSFSVNFGSVATTRAHVPAVQASFSMDSRAMPWLHVFVCDSNDERRSTSFNEQEVFRDGLKLGRADLSSMPMFFVRAARKLGVAWNWDEAWVSSSLRGSKRETVVRWLRSSP